MMLNVPLWGKPEECKLYIDFKREVQLVEVVWSFSVILSTLDVLAVDERLMPTWTLVPLIAACFLTPIIFKPKLRSKWRCPNCQTEFACRDILLRADYTYSRYIQQLTEQRIPFISSDGIVFPSKCPACGQCLYEQSYGKTISEIIKPTIKIWLAAVIIFVVIILAFFCAIVINVL